jgi:hypothetical protein
LSVVNLDKYLERVWPQLSELNQSIERFPRESLLWTACPIMVVGVAYLIDRAIPPTSPLQQTCAKTGSRGEPRMDSCFLKSEPRFELIR